MMSLFIVPKIGEIIEQRRQKIDDYVQKAEQINKKAYKTLERYNNKLQEAETRFVQESIADKQKAEAEAQLKEATLQHVLTEKIAQSRRTLADERAETLEVADNVSTKVADLILRKIGLS